jgi:hypothetical protein
MDEGSDFHERWKAWQLKGQSQEKALRRKMRVAIVVGLVVVALCLYLGLYTTALRY